jgi:feruloyl esterase
MGEKKTREFLRFYEVAGYGHALSSVFNASWDSLTALEDWVEKGVAPGPQTVSDSIGVPGRSRPLCEYPGWPKYRGAGDVNKAASFDCVTGDGKARAGS